MTVAPLSELTLYNQENDKYSSIRKQQESEISGNILQIVKKRVKK
ncbi:MAG: hypothetical protein PHS45_04730 [Bacilli bacterium]|nr:hypothetical protein [Bacilli bacterium]